MRWARGGGWGLAASESSGTSRLTQLSPLDASLANPIKTAAQHSGGMRLCEACVARDTRTTEKSLKCTARALYALCVVGRARKQLLKPLCARPTCYSSACSSSSSSSSSPHQTSNAANGRQRCECWQYLWYSRIFQLTFNEYKQNTHTERKGGKG